MACSTAKAMEWDAAWSKNPDPSGRAALGVHTDAYKEAAESVPAPKNANSVTGFAHRMQDGIVAAVTTTV